MEIKYVSLKEISKWPRNPKNHDLDQIDASIERFGFVQPLLVDERTGKLVAGHGRLETLQLMRAAGKPAPDRVRVVGKEWHVPVIRGIAFKNEREAEAYLLADNRLVEAGGWDEAKVAEILADLVGSGGVDALAGSGYSPEQADRLVAQIVGDIGSNEALEVPVVIDGPSAPIADSPINDDRLARFDLVPAPKKAWIVIATSSDRLPVIEAAVRKFEGDGTRIEVSGAISKN